MVASAALVSVYRAMLRKCRVLEQTGVALKLQEPFEEASWGSYKFESPGGLPTAERILPFLTSPPTAHQLAGGELLAYIRKCFKDGSMTSDTQEPLQKAFAALRAFLGQLYLMDCSSSCESDGIQVQACSCFNQMARDHRDDEIKYQYTYRVRVSNHRDSNIHVLGREWVFLNQDNKVEQQVVLSQNGVVGQQPVLPPGSTFEYCSGAFLSTPVGLAKGRLMVSVGGLDKTESQKILAQIAPFQLRAKASLQTAAAQ